MCGIFGIIGSYHKEEAKRALKTLAHRGPDAYGLFAKEDLFLGHYRLSIIDPHPTANQPMQIDGAVIVMNGEIYNYRDLQRELGGTFHTQSDTEVALRAFQRWSQTVPTHLRGMYAMAIWEKGVLHLLRDPFGKKPLYYAQVGETFIFASEIRAIRAIFPQIRWSRDRITSYLSYQSSISPHTFYPEIMQLEPGGYLRYEKGHVEIVTHDVMGVTSESGTMDDDTLDHLLHESIRYRLVSDAPLGALLSGGVDSSLVAAMAQKMYNQPLPTFTIGYKGFEKYDERKYAQIVADHIGSDHHTFEMGMEDFLETADALIEHLDEPLADPAAIPLWFLSRQIQSQGIKVLLSGDGADELFFGYRPYYEMADIEKARDLKYKNWLRNYFRSHYSPNREWEWYKRIFDDSVLFRSSAELFTDLQQNRLLKQNVKDDHSLTWIAHYIDRFGQTVGPQWYSFIDIKVQLGEVFLKKLDRVTMAHGIEARSPFMDRVLVERLFGCEPMWRMGEKPKWLLKRVAKRYLPVEIIERKKKGFSYPFMEWLHASGELDVIERINARYKLFDTEAVRFMIEKSKKGRFKHHLYAVWLLCKWIEKH
ncbi:MAG: asparagine synthase (glutamine-hydrolyzing) [Hydrogenimonas sp.]|nr:MAG: asparagine synthase (glutamine-hydrolyzing) [Hydrogenimonas sp.]